MKVTIKLFASLRKGRFDEEVKEYMDGVTVRKVMNELRITKDHTAIIFVNNKRVVPDQELFNGDVLALFPPIGGG